jgi:16S rRNA (adenine1518-N6/adenine1519-N6)-dimethyltransferase
VPRDLKRGRDQALGRAPLGEPSAGAPAGVDPARGGRDVLPARKRWGQHFLASTQTALRIVDAAEIDPTDTVVEVGPGDGALTRPLAGRCARLLAIEVDPLRAVRLTEEFAGTSQVRIAQGDVLDRSYEEWLAAAGFPPPAVLVANLPYNVATPILTAALDEPQVICRIVATVQREVAQRLVARPDDDGYGYLSVLAASRARCRILFDLPPGAFRPAPRVTSSVVDISPLPEPFAPGDRANALALASLGFRSRRKTLANALAARAPRACWEEALSEIGQNPRARAENLTLEDFVALSRAAGGGGASKP